MSGIAGIIHFDGKPVEPGLIEKMTSGMAHRGPDGINHWVNGSVALGQCMLRTTPESLEETQPLANKDESLVLVMDGRVDNWEELRLELLGKGAMLRDRSDAELVLRAYELWGCECLKHIDGDFALVIWDDRRREAFCARDRMGNKPFNYHWDGKKLVFASELHAILALSQVPKSINECMLAELLAAEWLSKEITLWQGILRLVEAHQMEANQDGLNLKQYWFPDFDKELLLKTDEEYIEYYRELFFDSVRRLSRSQAKVAYEVSGGLDSSAVFCSAELIRRRQKLSAPAIEGYTLAFPDDKNANELEYVRAVGDHTGVKINEIVPTITPLSWYRDWASVYQEFPGYPNGTMALGLQKIASEEGCRVLLGGSGGDEWFGTDRGIYYGEELASRRWRNLWKCFITDCREADIQISIWWFLRFGIVPLLPGNLQELLRLFKRKMKFGSVDSRVQNAVWLSGELQGAFANHRKNKPDPAGFARKRMGQYRQHQLLSDAYVSFAGELEERMASSMGLELRQPMQTSRLVEFAVATPERLRMHGQTNKFMHVQAMQDVLPPKVLKRRSKADFSILFRNHLENKKQELTQNVPEKRKNWVEKDRIQAVFECYQERLRTGNSSSGGIAQWILWNLLICDLFIDQIS